MDQSTIPSGLLPHVLLARFVRSNFGGSLTAKDAEQLAFTIFCTLDNLPVDFRNEVWDRAKIAREFSLLAEEGFFCDATLAHKQPEYWDATIDRFMSGKSEIDRQFRARLKQ